MLPLVHRGVMRSLTDWAKELGMGETTLSKRLRSGWTLERAFSEKVARRVRRHRACATCSAPITVPKNRRGRPRTFCSYVCKMARRRTKALPSP